MVAIRCTQLLSGCLAQTIYYDRYSGVQKFRNPCASAHYWLYLVMYIMWHHDCYCSGNRGFQATFLTVIIYTSLLVRMK